MNDTTSRKVAANITLSLDGRYHGPGGPPDFGAFVPYVSTDTAREFLGRIYEGKSTAVLGRNNAEGFMGYWAPLADDPSADPRDRGYASWFVGAQKVVFSTTVTTPPWERTRMVNAPVTEVIAELRANGEAGDILLNTAPSLAKPLLAADMVDRLYLMVFPEIVGGGERLFEDGLPASSWTLSSQVTGDKGELAMIYDRVR